jgi:hypothetical protein
VTQFDEPYVRTLIAALTDEVREMVAYKILHPPTLQEGNTAPPIGGDLHDSLVAGMPLEPDRLPDSELPTVSVTVESGVVRVEARDRILEYELYETVYHYMPDGRSPQEHAVWLAELWMEEAR